MILNFPVGKIFWRWWCLCFRPYSRILLIAISRAIGQSFAILLIFFWLVADTGLAIWRRWKLGNPTDRPDRLHFHQLSMRFLEIRFFGRDRRHLTNPIATLVLVPLISVPQVLGVLFWNDFYWTVWSTIFMSFLFVASYILGINLAKNSRGVS